MNNLVIIYNDKVVNKLDINAVNKLENKDFLAAIINAIGKDNAVRFLNLVADDCPSVHGLKGEYVDCNPDTNCAECYARCIKVYNGEEISL